jgi:hypothetical protein
LKFIAEKRIVGYKVVDLLVGRRAVRAFVSRAFRDTS